MSAQTRIFGDRTFNAVGYGGMGLSTAYGSVGTDEERLKVTNLHTLYVATAYGSRSLVSQILDGVYESGCTFWDTADVYGDNEELIAKWYAHASCKFSSH